MDTVFTPNKCKCACGGCKQPVVHSQSEGYRVGSQRLWEHTWETLHSPILGLLTHHSQGVTLQVQHLVKPSFYPTKVSHNQVFVKDHTNHFALRTQFCGQGLGGRRERGGGAWLWRLCADPDKGSVTDRPPKWCAVAVAPKRAGFGVFCTAVFGLFCTSVCIAWSASCGHHATIETPFTPFTQGPGPHGTPLGRTWPFVGRIGLVEKSCFFLATLADVLGALCQGWVMVW